MIPVRLQPEAGMPFLTGANIEQAACAHALRLLRRFDDLRGVDVDSGSRRAMISGLLADLRHYCDAVVHALAGDHGDPEADPRRACVVQLLEQLRQLECTPSATQRFDHRLQRVDWALRRLAQQPDALQRVDETVDPFQPASGIQQPMMHLPLN